MSKLYQLKTDHSVMRNATESSDVNDRWRIYDKNHGYDWFTIPGWLFRATWELVPKETPTQSEAAASCGTCEGLDCEGCQKAWTPPTVSPTIRLACEHCDREDFDGTTLAQATASGWTDIEAAPAGLDSVIDWWSHLGTCPDCIEPSVSPPAPLPPAFDAKAVREEFAGVVSALGAWAPPWKEGFRIASDAALAEIVRLQPFEARCHEIDLAEQRLAARTAEDAKAETEKPVPFDAEAWEIAMHKAIVDLESWYGHYAVKPLRPLKDAALDEIKRGTAVGVEAIHLYRQEMKKTAQQSDEITRLKMEADLHRETINAQDEEIRKKSEIIANAADSMRAQAEEIVRLTDDRDLWQRRAKKLAEQLKEINAIWKARAEAAESQLAAVTADRDRFQDSYDAMVGDYAQLRELSQCPERTTLEEWLPTLVVDRDAALADAANLRKWGMPPTVAGPAATPKGEEGKP